MQLNTIQNEVLNTNLKPAKELAESLYKQSKCNGRKHIPLAKRQAQLKHLSILLDDMNGALQEA
jgi:hypothetical protein